MPVLGTAELGESGITLRHLDEDSERRKINLAARQSIQRIVAIRAEYQPSLLRQGTHIVYAESMDAVQAALRHDPVREGYLRWVSQWSGQTRVENNTNAASWYAPLKHIYSEPEISWAQSHELSLYRNGGGAGWMEPQADINQSQTPPQQPVSSIAGSSSGQHRSGRSRHRQVDAPLLARSTTRPHSATERTEVASARRAGLRPPRSRSGFGTGTATYLCCVAGVPNLVGKSRWKSGNARCLALLRAGPAHTGLPRYTDSHPQPGSEISATDRQKLIERALDKGECLILLDGLDELAAAGARSGSQEARGDFHHCKTGNRQPHRAHQP